MNEPIAMRRVTGKDAFNEALQFLGDTVPLVEMSDEEIFQRVMIFRVVHTVSGQALNCLEKNLEDRGIVLSSEFPFSPTSQP